MRNYKIAYSIISGLEVKAWECEIKKGTFYLPSDSTFKPPLKAKEGYNVIWKNDKWTYKKISQPPKPKEPTLEELKQSAKDQIIQARRLKQYSPIIFEGSEYPNSETAQNKFFNLLFITNGDIEWRLSDNINWVTLTRQKADELAKKIREQETSLYKKESQLLKAVNDAKTKVKINNLKIKF